MDMKYVEFQEEFEFKVIEALKKMQAKPKIVENKEVVPQVKGILMILNTEPYSSLSSTSN